MRWLALKFMVGAVAPFVIALPVQAQWGEVTKLTGCGSQKPPARQSAKAWRAVLNKQPTRANWRDALVDWSDGNALDSRQCLSVRRLQQAAKAYKLDVVRVPIPHVVNDFANRPPDWFDHAQRASDNGIPGETVAVIDEQRATGQAGFGRQIGGLRENAKRRDDALKRSNPPTPPNAPVVGTRTWQKLNAEGSLWLNSGGFAEAASYFDKASIVGGFNPVIDLARGYAHYRAGQIPAAITVFKAVKARGGSIDAELAEFWLLFLKAGAR